MSEAQSGQETNVPGLSDLFVSFLKLGTVAFGGPAMVAYAHDMAVDKKKWLDDQSFKDGVSLAQSLPGATTMQVAAYVGLRAHGVAGAAASYIGFALPTFLLMTVFSAVYAEVHTMTAISAIFSSLRVVILAIIANAALSFGKASLKRWRDVLISITAAALFLIGTNPMLVIALAAILGLLFNIKESNAGAHFGNEMGPTAMRPFAFAAMAVALYFGILFVVDRDLFRLSALMSRIDLFAFGAGYTSVPLMFHEVVDVPRSGGCSPLGERQVLLGRYGF